MTVLCVFGAVFGQEGLPGGRTPITDETKLISLKDKMVTHLPRLDTGENADPLEIVRIHTATSQVVAGPLYEIFAEMKENKNLVNCTISLWEKPWVEDFIRLTVECGEEKRKYQFASGKDDRRRKRQISFGGFNNLSENGAKELHPKLTAAFDQLKTQKPDFDLTFKRVVSGKYQVVSGTIYQVIVEATNQANEVKTCEADILENLHDEFDRVELKCGNQNHLWTKQ